MSVLNILCISVSVTSSVPDFAMQYGWHINGNVLKSR